MMFELSIAALAYSLSVLITLWLVRRHLLLMRADVQKLAKDLLRETIEQGKAHAREKVKQVGGLVTQSVATVLRSALDEDRDQATNTVAPRPVGRISKLVSRFLRASPKSADDPGPNTNGA